MTNKTTMVFGAVAMMLALSVTNANAKYDEGVGKQEANAHPMSADKTCQHRDSMSGRMVDSKYDHQYSDCSQTPKDGAASSAYKGREMMLDGNHKLQWQQGYSN